MKKNFKILERVYFGFLFVLYILAILTPLIINFGVSFLREEFIEAGIISVLIMVSYFTLVLYRREVKKNLDKLRKLEYAKKSLEDRLTEASKYIGAVNVQINEIRSIIGSLKKYPESKKDYKYIMRFFAEKILGIINTDWVLLRIIDLRSKKTLREHTETRASSVLLKQPVGNGDIIEGNIPPDLTLLKTLQDNFAIRTVCLLPLKKISKEQKIMIMAIINQLEMLFLIFASTYYKNIPREGER